MGIGSRLRAWLAPDRVLNSSPTVTIKGKRHQLSRIAVGDVADMVARIRSMRYEALRKGFETMRGIPGIDRNIAMARLAAIDPTMVDLQRYLQTAPGLSYMIWLNLSKSDPSLTEEDVAEDITEQIDLLMEVMAESSPPAEEESFEDADPTRRAQEPSKETGPESQHFLGRRST